MSEPLWWEEPFLKALQRNDDVKASADVVDISRSVVYDRRERSTPFRERWDEIRARHRARRRRHATYRAQQL